MALTFLDQKRNTAAADRSQKEITGIMEKQVFYDEDTRTIIAKLKDGTSIVGECQDGEIEKNITYRFLGRWADHYRYGPQFHFETFIMDKQMDRTGVVRYLCTTITHIGQVTAEKLWAKFGPDTIDVLRDAPEKVTATGLMTEKNALIASNELKQDADLIKTRVELFGLFSGRGFPRKLIQAVIEKWGAKGAEIIRRNPYALMVNEMPGCGFLRCDKLYLDFGFPPTALKRQMLAGWYGMHSNAEGHTWHPRGIFLRDIMRAVGGKDKTNADKALELGIRAGWLAGRQEKGEIKWIAEASNAGNELTVASIVKTMLADTTTTLLWPSMDDAADLSEHQRAGLRKCLAKRIGVLAGTPGTGKTFSAARVIGAIARQFGITDLVVCAPTGKAAVRLTEVMSTYGIGIKATTIHRLLGVVKSGRGKGGGYQFEYNEKKRLPVRFVIADEQSMTDTNLMASLLKALSGRAHLLLIGDINQLPPVGHGAPLRDMIEAGVPHAELTEIRRNAGLIVEACRDIKCSDEKSSDGVRRNGRFKTCEKFNPDTGDNLRHFECDNPGDVLEYLEKILLQFQTSGKFDPAWDCQVLVATNESTALSRTAVNLKLQGLLNPLPADADVSASQKFRLGDKVMCLKNSLHTLYATDDGSPSHLVDAYWPASDEQGNTEVFVANGEIGRVLAANPSHAVLEFPDPKRIIKTFMAKGKQRSEEEKEEGEGKDAFDLAYAITVHKSQGSEAPVIILLVDDGAGRVTCREHVYTAISRAKKLCITIGKMDTLLKQCRKKTLARRKTFLKELICEPADSGNSVQVKLPGDSLNRGFVYLGRKNREEGDASTSEDAFIYKIGCTQNPAVRAGQLSSEHETTVEFIEVFPAFDHYALEKLLHRHHAAKRITGEWFALSLEDVQNFRVHAHQLEHEHRNR